MIGLFAAAALPVLAPPSLAAGVLNLPAVPVGVTQQWHGALGNPGTLTATLAGVPAGFDVTNGQYPGWCMEDNFRPDLSSSLTLYDSTDAPGNLPLTYQGKPWDKINYLLNHKGNALVTDVQVALWLLMDYYNGTFPITPAAQALAAAANANGAGFIPGNQQVVAVLIYADGIGPAGYQDTLIEVKLEVLGNEGGTPGFWKNHLGAWAATGYSPSDKFDAIFGPGLFDPNLTLLQAINAKGGHFNRLARHAVAALLDASHPGIEYTYTVAQVIALVQAGDADALEMANELPCPLGKADF